MSQEEENYLSSKLSTVDHVSIYSKELENELNKQPFEDYLRVLYLCHDILVEKNEAGKITYSSGSPDEIALINFTKIYGR